MGFIITQEVPQRVIEPNGFLTLGEMAEAFLGREIKQPWTDDLSQKRERYFSEINGNEIQHSNRTREKRWRDSAMICVDEIIASQSPGFELNPEFVKNDYKHDKYNRAMHVPDMFHTTTQTGIDNKTIAQGYQDFMLRTDKEKHLFTQPLRVQYILVSKVRCDSDGFLIKPVMVIPRESLMKFDNKPSRYVSTSRVLDKEGKQVRDVDGLLAHRWKFLHQTAVRDGAAAVLEGEW